MTNHDSSANKSRLSIQNIASWIGRIRSPERAEDLVTNPAEDEIVFTTLSPITGTPGALNSFSLLSEIWIRRRCDPYHFDRGMHIAGEGRAVITESTQDSIRGCVATGDAAGTAAIAVTLSGKGCDTHCTCEAHARALDTGRYSSNRIWCEHVAAALLHTVAHRKPQAPMPEMTAVCPVTRQTLSAGSLIYRCARCGLNISKEGWEFLRDADRGRCCGCHARGAISAVPADAES